MRAWLLLLLSEQPAHGWELRGRMRELGAHWHSGGTVYRDLRALEAEGFVRSDWQPSSNGPRRRMYRVTPEGRRALDRHAREFTERRQSLSRFLRHHRRLTGGPLTAADG